MKSYNNAFELLTDDPKEVESYTMRSNLMNEIVGLIKRKGWTQKEAAQYLIVPQQCISNIQNGEISKCSLYMLEAVLSDARGE